MKAAARRQSLMEWFHHSGRSGLPWRRRRSAYRTLVSEFMLQQTQVDRVVPKFLSFVRRFPTARALAAASTGDVLREWQGLGYNARAVRLHGVAKAVVERHGGRLPKKTEQLRALPGIGAYTAAAIRAFAYDLDDLPLDVNIERVLHRLFVGVEHPRKATGATLAEQGFRQFGGGYATSSALMDLGALVCTARNPACETCPVRDGCVAAPIDATVLERLRASRKEPGASVPFAETARHARGRIVDRLRALPPGVRISLLDLHRDLRRQRVRRSVEEVRHLVGRLHREGIVVLQDDDVRLP